MDINEAIIGVTQKVLVRLAAGGWRKYAALAYLCLATCKSNSSVSMAFNEKMVGVTQKVLVRLAAGGWRKNAALAYLCLATCVLAVYLTGRQICSAVVRSTPDLLLSIAAALRWNKVHRSLTVILPSSADPTPKF